MKIYGSLLTLAATLLACAASALIQNQLTSCSAQTTAAPCVDKVDPPNWWPSLPSLMLLLHGGHLDGAKFSLAGKDVSISKSQVSANGHYAFLWLDTAHTAPQNIEIRVTSRSGSVTAPFRLDRRRPADHSGFSAVESCTSS